jgi:DNA-directed RNA polymerase specialized sigma24 family protein
MQENQDQGWEAFFRHYHPPALDHLKRLGCRDEDLAHDIFMEVTLYWRSHRLSYVPGQAKFRTFLRRALEFRLQDEWDRQNAQKRGSGSRPISLDQTPDRLPDGAGSLHDLIADPRRTTHWMDVEKLREYVLAHQEFVWA